MILELQHRRPDGDVDTYHLKPGRRYHLGRGSSCEVRILDLKLSRKHAALEYQDGGWKLIDLCSTNGCRLDGQAMTGTVALHAGAVVEIGQTSLTISQIVPRSPPTLEPVARAVAPVAVKEPAAPAMKAQASRPLEAVKPAEPTKPPAIPPPLPPARAPEVKAPSPLEAKAKPSAILPVVVKAVAPESRPSGPLSAALSPKNAPPEVVDEFAPSDVSGGRAKQQNLARESSDYLRPSTVQMPAIAVPPAVVSKPLPPPPPARPPLPAGPATPTPIAASPVLPAPPVPAAGQRRPAARVTVRPVVLNAPDAGDDVATELPPGMGHDSSPRQPAPLRAASKTPTGSPIANGASSASSLSGSAPVLVATPPPPAVAVGSEDRSYFITVLGRRLGPLNRAVARDLKSRELKGVLTQGELDAYPQA